MTNYISNTGTKNSIKKESINWKFEIRIWN